MKKEELVNLRHTIGSNMWLDSLTDKEFEILAKEIITVFEAAKRIRYGLTIIYTKTICPSCGYDWIIKV